MCQGGKFRCTNKQFRQPQIKACPKANRHIQFTTSSLLHRTNNYASLLVNQSAHSSHGKIPSTNIPLTLFWNVLNVNITTSPTSNSKCRDTLSQFFVRIACLSPPILISTRLAHSPDCTHISLGTVERLCLRQFIVNFLLKYCIEKDGSQNGKT